MLFLSPALLWFLAAASVPVLIHLLNRRRHKTIRWAAMQFLLKATRESRGKKKLRHFLILACRTLAIVALVCAAARPVVSGLLGWGGGTVDVVVLVLDRSATMELHSGDGQPTRRQAVLTKVRDSFKAIGASRLVLLDSATGEPLEIPSPDVLPDISAAGATDTAADFPALLSRAAEYLRETTGRAEIWLASDLQASNWQPNAERWTSARALLSGLPQKPVIRVLGLTGPASPDAALTLTGARRSGDDLLLDLELLRSSDNRSATSIPLTTTLNGTHTTENLVIPGQTLKFQKRIALPPGSDNGYGWLSIPADGNEHNNPAFFAYGPALPVKSLVVAPFRSEAADYLALAAAPPAFGAQSVAKIDPAQAATLTTNDISTILWAAPLPSGPIAEKLARFAGDGGQIIFFPPGSPPAEPFLEQNWEPVKIAAKDRFFILKDWNHDDGPLRDGLDGLPVAGDRLKAIRRQIPSGAATVLARWDDGQPFLTRQITGRGTVWFVGVPPDYAWSNLGDGDILLPLVQRIVAIGAARFDTPCIATVGTPAATPLPGETRTRLDDYSTPDPANAAYLAGVFKLGDRLMAVNRPIIEDQPETLAREELDSALQGTGFTLLEQAGRAGDPTLARDVWRAFLVALVLFLIAEAILCIPPSTPAKALASATPRHY